MPGQGFEDRWLLWWFVSVLRYRARDYRSHRWLLRWQSLRLNSLARAICRRTTCRRVRLRGSIGEMDCHLLRRVQTLPQHRRWRFWVATSPSVLHCRREGLTRSRGRQSRRRERRRKCVRSPRRGCRVPHSQGQLRRIAPEWLRRSNRGLPSLSRVSDRNDRVRTWLRGLPFLARFFLGICAPRHVSFSYRRKNQNSPDRVLAFCWHKLRIIPIVHRKDTLSQFPLRCSCRHLAHAHWLCTFGCRLVGALRKLSLDCI